METDEGHRGPQVGGCIVLCTHWQRIVSWAGGGRIGGWPSVRPARAMVWPGGLSLGSRVGQAVEGGAGVITIRKLPSFGPSSGAAVRQGFSPAIHAVANIAACFELVHIVNGRLYGAHVMCRAGV